MAEEQVEAKESQVHTSRKSRKRRILQKGIGLGTLVNTPLGEKDRKPTSKCCQGQRTDERSCYSVLKRIVADRAKLSKKTIQFELNFKELIDKFLSLEMKYFKSSIVQWYNFMSCLI